MEPAPVAAPRTRLRLLTATKVVVSAGLLYWVLSRSNLGEVLAAAGSAHVGLLLFAYSLHLVGLYLSATRWKGLLRAQSIEASTVFLMKSFLVGIFFNHFLPSTVGGDASRAYDSYRLGNKKASAMTSVVVDRLLGLLALMTFAVMALPFSHQITNRIPLLPLWVGVGAAGIGMTVWMVFFPPRVPLLRELVSKLPVPIGRSMRKFVGAFGAYRGKGMALAKAFGLSILLQANVVLFFIVVARTLGLAIPVHSFFLIVPLSLFVMMLPISINGIGLRENILALFLATYGVATSAAVAYAWLIYLASLIWGLFGGLVYALRR